MRQNILWSDYSSFRLDSRIRYRFATGKVIRTEEVELQDSEEHAFCLVKVCKDTNTKGFLAI